MAKIIPFRKDFKKKEEAEPAPEEVFRDAMEENAKRKKKMEEERKRMNAKIKRNWKLS